MIDKKNIPFLVSRSDDDAAWRVAGPGHARRYERKRQWVEPLQARACAGYQGCFGDEVRASSRCAAAQEPKRPRISAGRCDREGRSGSKAAYPRELPAAKRLSYEAVLSAEKWQRVNVVDRQDLPAVQLRRTIVRRAVVETLRRGAAVALVVCQGMGERIRQPDERASLEPLVDRELHRVIVRVEPVLDRVDGDNSLVRANGVQTRGDCGAVHLRAWGYDARGNRGSRRHFVQVDDAWQVCAL